MYAGAPHQLQDEVTRLSERLAQLTAGEASVAAVSVDTAADPQRTFLATMLEWRRQRLQTLQAEIERLKGLLVKAGMPYAEPAGGAATVGSAGVAVA